MWVVIFLNYIARNILVLNLLCFSRIFHFCTLSSSGFSVGREKLYEGSLHVHMLSFVDVHDDKNKKKIAFSL